MSVPPDSIERLEIRAVFRGSEVIRTMKHRFQWKDCSCSRKFRVYHYSYTDPKVALILSTVDKGKQPDDVFALASSVGTTKDGALNDLNSPPCGEPPGW